MERRYLSRRETSIRLGVSTKTIDRWIRSGRIRAFKPSGNNRVLIDIESLTEENLMAAKPKYLNL